MTNPAPMPIANRQPPIPAPNPRRSPARPPAYQHYCRQFFDEYQPANPTETQLTQELADTAWRLNGIPLLEAALLDRAANPPTGQAAIDFDIVDAHRALATLGLHCQRSPANSRKRSTNFAKSNPIAVSGRSHLKQAAAPLELHKHKGIPYDPATFGFVFSKAQRVRRAPPSQQETVSRRTPFCAMFSGESRHIEHVLFHMPPTASSASALWEPRAPDVPGLHPHPQAAPFRP